MDMEIESSGRSVDRSRELSIKKPRMTAVGDDADKDRDRGFQRYAERERSLERPLAQRGSPMLERMRAIERERERERDKESDKGGRIIEDDKNVEREREDTTTTTTSSRGGGSQHELVSQYKTALAELTFNSKPIITNLTIIAGENSHAAKGIAATVCSHILEVPNEQKLPSLYLLDSIVKNIGGDYVKYFAAKLPEVFCTAYRQVDPVTHPGMQHLFRTWKGVFPPTPLHVIEEELRFPSMNGSSSGTTTPRSSDTQSQRPGHSIHVNPKYLERLQQSNKAERLNSENTGDEPLHESDRSDRLDRNMRTSPKGWSETPVKRPNIQRPPRGDTFGEPIYAQKPSTGFADYDYGMDHVRSSELLMGRPNERITERNDGLERPWYGERLGEIQSSNTGGTYSQRNGYDWQKMPARGPLLDAYGNIRGPKLALGPQSNSTAPHDIGNRSSRVMPRNWQNSEEEEYMWEDTSTRLADAGRGSDKLRKGDWFPGDINKPLGLGRGKRMEPEPDLPDGHWRTVGPLSQMDQPISDEGQIPRRELDDRLASPLLHHDVGTRSSREASAEGSFLGRTGQNALVHRSLPGWTKQNLSSSANSRPRVLPMDLQSSLPSINAVQSEGYVISPFSGGMLTSIEPSSETRLGLRTSNGIGTGPPSFGPLPSVTPLSTGLSSRQRQSPRPPSPSTLLSAQQLPGSPTSLARQQSVQPVQHQQQINLTRAGHLQVKTQTTQPSPFLQQSHVPVSQMQQVLQPQNTADSSNQLPHGYVQSGSSLQQLQMAQEIQISQQFQNRPSGIPPQQGQSLQFLQQAPGEPPLLHVQSVSLPQPLVPSHPLQQPDLKSTPQPPPPSYGPPQTPGFAANGFPTNASSSLQGQTQNLLEVILNSGLLPPSTIQAGSTPKTNSSSGYSGFPEFGKTQPPLHIQPPLPSGPPPVQFSAAPTVSSSLPPVVSLPIPTPASSLPGPSAVPVPLSVNNLQLLHSQPPRPVQPPLPPGPPPASSLVGSSSQATSSVTPPRSSILPVSNLLNSLMAKGIISAPTESTSLPTSLPATSSMPNQLNSCSTVVVTTSNLQASVSVPVADDSPVLTKVATTPLETSVETLCSTDPIGVEFKRERILERHVSVINALYDDFPRQCMSCGLRFMSHEEHCKHMDWHASKNLEPKMKMSHGWFSRLHDWVSGTGPSVTEVAASVFPLESNKMSKDNEEPAVPSDENQLICPLCEELFEEFYSHETDEWMCKGTVYLNVPPGASIGSMDQSLLGPIVHEKCRSGTAAVTLGGSEENDVDDEDDLGCRRKTVQY
ncbi:polyadenylation and cleavage factor homolog 4 [Cryptomeria japonica]|uniref:polyadenylation and cleavage factor homolog 4 n=1 Tax=Cryptomeria japonica TaxID=3369 RepID=UPI0025AB6AF0|nr:polyadenylation and cleavage factor homolog 4 [Cryptomeria japonica]